MAAALTTREPGAARALLVAAVCLVAVVLGVVLLALTPDAERLPPGGRLVPVLVVVVGWSFAGLGAFASWRRPDNATGALMAAFGLAVLLSGMVISDARLPYLVSGLADALALAVFVHLLLSFPSGHLEDRASRCVVAASYATSAVPQLVAMLLGEPAGDPGCDDCPRNPILVASHDGVADAALIVEVVAGLALALAAVALVVRRARASSPFQRRAFAPLAAAGAVLLVLAAVSICAQALELSDGAQKAAQLLFIAAFTGLPVAFLAGLQRSRFFRAATVGSVIDRLAVGDGAPGVEAALAAALGDPSLAVAFWLPERDGYVDREGRPMTLPATSDGAVATEITHHGHRVGALVHDGALSEGLGAHARRGRRGRPGARERAPRGRAARPPAGAARVARADRRGGRRRAPAPRARPARRGPAAPHLAPARPPARARVLGERARVLAEARRSRARERPRRRRGAARPRLGIHPAVLSQRGLDAALESLATRSPVPVEADVVLDERLPSPPRLRRTSWSPRR